jgi:hypothetical protein
LLLELSTLGGGVGEPDSVVGGEGPVVGLSRHRPRLDDDKASGVLGEKFVDLGARGVEGEEGVFTRGPVVNAGVALVPARVDGWRGTLQVSKRNKGNHPFRSHTQFAWILSAAERRSG